MLLDFTVKNFRSFKNETVLSAEAGERLRKYNNENTKIINGKRILKDLFIFGPNGTGKSNLLMGLKAMKKMVLNDPPKITTKLPYQPFAFGNETSNDPVELKISFTFKKKIYIYSFGFIEDRIIHESLKICLKGKEETYFERYENKFRVIPDELRLAGKQTKKNTLFLYSAQKLNDEDSTNVVEWFNNDLIFFEDFVHVNRKIKKLIGDERTKNALVKFLKFADINIENLFTQEHKIPEPIKKIIEKSELANDDEFKEEITTEIVTEHKCYDDKGRVISKKIWNIDNESEGTKKLFLIGLVLVYAKRFGDNKVLIFDEFENSLHRELSCALVKILNSTQNNSQVISTTHELKILDSGLRTDQIYFVEKDFRGISSIKSIFDFKDSKGHGRVDITYVKRYIAGLYGAYPHINEDEMREALNSVCEDGDADA